MLIRFAFLVVSAVVVFVVVVAALLMLLFLFLYYYLLSHSAAHTCFSLSFSSLFFSCTDSSTVLALSLVTFSSPSPQTGRTLIIRRLFFTYSIIHFFCCCCFCCWCCITYIYFNFSTSTLTHCLHILLWLAGWLFNRENYLPSANPKFSQEVSRHEKTI